MIDESVVWDPTANKSLTTNSLVDTFSMVQMTQTDEGTLEVTGLPEGMTVTTEPDTGFVCGCGPDYLDPTCSLHSGQAAMRSALADPGLFEQMETDAAERPLPNDDQLARVARLAREKGLLEDEIEHVEAALAELHDKHNHLTNSAIPDLMREFGLKEFTLLDGRQVQVATKYYASISEERRDNAHLWLRRHGHGGMIKNTFKVALGAGDGVAAKRLKAYLEKRGLGFDMKEAVHPSTLGAFVKEQIEAGKFVPLEVLGAHVEEVAKIVEPKKLRKKKGQK